MPAERIDIPRGRILIAPISEAPAMEGWLEPSDRIYLKAITMERRRAEGIVWRALVRMEGIKGDIAYAEAGGPVIMPAGDWRYIGVSHSSELAVVIFSSDRCAVDTEPLTRNFDRAAPRFISPEESALRSSSHPLFKAALWCGKETLYKLSGRTALDLLADLRITGIDFVKGKMTGAIRGPEGSWQDHALALMINRGNLIVYS